MIYDRGFVFEGFEGKIEQMHIELTDEALASALKLSSKAQFYNIFRSRDEGLDISYEKALEVVSSYHNASTKERWMTEKLYNAMVDPQVFNSLLSVVANSNRFPEQTVKDCRAVLMTAIKKGADVYAVMSKALVAERQQKLLYESQPSSIWSYEELQQYANANKVMFEMEPTSPYKHIFDIVSKIVDLQVEEDKAEEAGDRKRFIELRKELKNEEAKLDKAVYGFEPEMLSKVAKGHSEFVKLQTKPDVASLKEEKEQAIVSQLYKRAKELELKEKERDGLRDEELEYETLSKKKDDEN
ncbi:MAG: hypothetical protein IJZ62_03455 [Clostridia bacterium]|nr:hypothetical protein [Clostridia bacterium]